MNVGAMCSRGAGLGTACASTEDLSKLWYREVGQQCSLPKAAGRVENSSVFGTALMLTKLGAH